MEALYIDISIPPPSFKPISLALPRSSLSKTPKQVFFNPIKYIWTSFTQSVLLLFNLLFSFFSFNVQHFVFTGTSTRWWSQYRCAECPRLLEHPHCVGRTSLPRIQHGLFLGDDDVRVCHFDRWSHFKCTGRESCGTIGMEKTRWVFYANGAL